MKRQKSERWAAAKSICGRFPPGAVPGKDMNRN